jgi:hypothetical protein
MMCRAKIQRRWSGKRTASGNAVIEGFLEDDVGVTRPWIWTVVGLSCSKTLSGWKGHH